MGRAGSGGAHQWETHLCPGLRRMALRRDMVSSCPYPPFSVSTALSPEEAESALEATHYFIEDSSLEGKNTNAIIATVYNTSRDEWRWRRMVGAFLEKCFSCSTQLFC
uniref:TBC1 domain family member 9B n=1 Tax=Molossus molossus TaxID=27622 RepID=A0A7J8IDH2_MOLMO|nr:TBC1 domain family member 9B [Molossus molossus]